MGKFDRRRLRYCAVRAAAAAALAKTQQFAISDCQRALALDRRRRRRRRPASWQRAQVCNLAKTSAKKAAMSVWVGRSVRGEIQAHLLWSNMRGIRS